MDSLETGADKVVRVPANIMGLLRQSYDSREKVLDWILALTVVIVLVWIFRDQLLGMVASDATDPNAGRADEPTPNLDVRGAFPFRGTGPDLYSYNMPVSREIRYSVGPSATRVPGNPAVPPSYSADAT